MTRIKITARPVAQSYALPGERIIEYSEGYLGVGGLIAFKVDDKTSELVVSLYRHDGPVRIEIAGEDKHIVELRSGTYGLQHPRACRPNLLDCQIDQALSAMSKAVDSPDVIGSMPPGRYEVQRREDGLLAFFHATTGELA